MCGINGFNWEDKELVKRMNKKLAHRGPDDSGIYISKDVSLGHTRLSIIDLSEKGKQPMSDEEGEVILVFNGEIYNFLKLKEDPRISKHDFKSKTDSEVLIYLYKEYGEKMLEKIEGMFAFCIYDAKKNIFFFARDRFGKKPLYYYFDGEKFIFASEIKAILEHEIDIKMDKESLTCYLTYGYSFDPKTIFSRICQVRCGQAMTFDLKTKKIKKWYYWKAGFSIKERSVKENRLKLLEYFDCAVKKRLIADVPLGAFLSGGIDSSAVVSYLSEYKKNYYTFSIGFDRQDFDESKYANLVSDIFNTKHKIIEVDAEDVQKTLELLPKYFDEPFADTSVIPTYLVSKLAREKVKVSLSGDGGDELFGGYEWYIWHNIMRKYSKVPKILNTAILKTSSALNKIKGSELFHKFEYVTKKHRLRDYKLYAEMKKVFPYKYGESYFKGYFRGDGLNDLIRSDINTFLPFSILKKVDVCSMANSLEIRSPFLDTNLFGFASSLPINQKIRLNQKKYILKKALEKRLPKNIIYRKKKGFSTPLKHYFRDELKSYVYDVLNEGRTAKISPFNQKKINRILEMHNSRRETNTGKIFTLLQLELFLRNLENKGVSL